MIRIKTPRKSSVSVVMKIWDSIEALKSTQKEDCQVSPSAILDFLKYNFDKEKGTANTELYLAVHDGLLLPEATDSGVLLNLPQSAVKEAHDWYCFECHLAGGHLFGCNLCPKVFHGNCLKKFSVSGEWDNEECPACNAEMIATDEGWKEKQRLSSFLKLVASKMQDVVVDSGTWTSQRLWSQWRCDQLLHFSSMESSYDVDGILRRALMGRYGALEEFWTDCQIALHNVAVYFGTTELSGNDAVLRFRNLMEEIKACPECFERSFSENPSEAFTLQCSKPHDAVLVQREGNLWPAKLLRKSEDRLEVIFFGDRLRNWIRSETSQEFISFPDDTAIPDPALRSAYQELRKFLQLELLEDTVCENIPGPSQSPTGSIRSSFPTKVPKRKRRRGRLGLPVKKTKSDRIWEQLGKISKEEPKNVDSSMKVAEENDNDSERLWEVDGILDFKIENGRELYFIKWKGYSAEANSWEPKSNLDCDDLIEELHQNLAKNPKKRSSLAPEPETSRQEKEEWEVEQVLDYKFLQGVIHYKVAWKGYSIEEATWEPEENLSNCKDLLEEFWELRPKPSKNQPRAVLFEVEAILKGRVRAKGLEEYLISWKGYGRKHNSWELASNLDCPDLIQEFLQKQNGSPPKSPEHPIPNIRNEEEAAPEGALIEELPELPNEHEIQVELSDPLELPLTYRIDREGDAELGLVSREESSLAESDHESSPKSTSEPEPETVFVDAYIEEMI